MPLSQVPRPPDPPRVAALLGRRRAGGDEDPPAEQLEAELRAARRPGLVTVPDQVRLGRVRVPTAAVVAVLALVLAAACLFLVRVLWAERAAGAASPAAPPSGVTVTSAGGPAGADPSSTTAGPGPTGGGDGTGGSATGEAAASEQVVVHVVGQVARPGLVRLQPGARVADAITEAGGPTKQADLAALNLARPVTDGEQVHVPRPGETPPVPQGPSPPGTVSDGSGGAAGGAGGGLVNLNSADQATLESLPGVGPVLAQRILEWRSEHGRFTSVEELREVSGIGDKVFARLQPKVTV
jgi:competence protein ComEA